MGHEAICDGVGCFRCVLVVNYADTVENALIHLLTTGAIGYLKPYVWTTHPRDHPMSEAFSLDLLQKHAGCSRVATLFGDSRPPKDLGEARGLQGQK